MAKHLIDMYAVMQHVPEILGMELTWRKDAWEGRYYINGERHPYKRDKLKVKFWKAPDGRTHIILHEQGNNSMSIQSWLIAYGGAVDYKHALDIMRDCQPCALELGDIRTRSNEDVRYIDKSVYEQYRQYELERCNLFAFMCRLFGEERVRSVWEAYNVTTNERGDVVFWYVDAEGRICHDKIIAYKLDGHRNKQFGGFRKFKTDMGYRARCLFGSHLIIDDKELNIVESEKSCLVLKCAFPDKTWLATGGLNQLRECEPNMLLYPDIDGISKWESLKDARIVPWWENATELGDKDDYADLIIREKMGNYYMGRYR